MQTVSLDELCGFRRPSKEESGLITPYIKSIISREMLPMNIWQAICSVLAAFIMISLFGNSGGYSLGYFFVITILLITTVLSIFLIRLYRRKKKEVIRNMENEEYWVMNCKIYEVYFDNSLNSEAEVKIYNQMNQYCEKKFTIDIETARKFKYEVEKPALLLFRSNDNYILLSENRLRGEIK